MRPKEHILLSLWLRFDARLGKTTHKQSNPVRRQEEMTSNFLTSVVLEKRSYCPSKVTHMMIILEPLFTWAQVSDTLETWEKTHGERTYPQASSRCIVSRIKRKEPYFRLG